MSKKTQSVYKKKNRSNKNKSIKKRDKRVWIYSVGKIAVVYRVPRLHIKSIDMRGGAGKDESDTLAATIMKSIKEQAKNKVSEKELEIIEKTLNKQNVCESTDKDKGMVSSMTSKAFNGITQGAVSLGKFLAPTGPTSEIRRRNDTTIQMLWYPRATDHYRKGTSVATPKDKIRYGDFMIYIEPERYADTIAYFSNATNTVEDLFANILNGCTDSLCLKGEPIPQPYKHKVYQINNYQPAMDDM